MTAAGNQSRRMSTTMPDTTGREAARATTTRRGPSMCVSSRMTRTTRNVLVQTKNSPATERKAHSPSMQSRGAVQYLRKRGGAGGGWW